MLKRTEVLPARLSSFFMWKKSFKVKPVARESGSHECGDECSRSGQYRYFEVSFATCTCEEKSGIRDAGGAGIRYQRDGFSFLQQFDYLFGRPVFIVCVIGAQRSGDLVMIEQASRDAGIFRQDEVGGFQYLECAVCDVTQVTDRCGDNVKHLKLA